MIVIRAERFEGNTPGNSNKITNFESIFSDLITSALKKHLVHFQDHQHPDFAENQLIPPQLFPDRARRVHYDPELETFPLGLVIPVVAAAQPEGAKNLGYQVSPPACIAWKEDQELWFLGQPHGLPGIRPLVLQEGVGQGKQQGHL